MLSIEQITVVNLLTVIVFLFCVFRVLRWVIEINKVAIVFVPAASLASATKITSLILLIARHALITWRALMATWGFIDPVPVTSVIRRLWWEVFATWLVKQLIWIVIVVVLHGCLHFFLESLFEPFLCRRFVVRFVYFVFVLIFDVGNEWLNCFEFFWA